jgi:hypothetical protein
MQNRLIFRFNPETAEMSEIASDLEEWADKILNDYSLETGWPLAHDWQEKNRPLKPFERLIPTIPFVLGGEFRVVNLYAEDAVKSMQFRSDIWRQTKDLPDGAKVKIRTI